MGYNVMHDLGNSPGYVYMMRRGPYFKIGRSVNLERRKYSVKYAITPREARAYPIEFVSAIVCKDQFLAERAVHRRFAPYQSLREWFLLPDDEIAWFCRQESDAGLW